MQEREAAMLISTGTIDSAVIYRTPDGDWELHLYGDALPASITNAVEKARGGKRTWVQLGSAFEFLCSIRGARKVATTVDG